jgi:hypothetical protein
VYRKDAWLWEWIQRICESSSRGRLSRVLLPLAGNRDQARRNPCGADGRCEHGSAGKRVLLLRVKGKPGNEDGNGKPDAPKP